MWLKEFLTNKIILRNLGLALIITIVLIWLSLMILSFYTNKGENLPAPELKGLTIKQLETLAQEHEFRFVIEDSVFRKNTIPGTVIFQNPSAGHKIKPNRLITIITSSVKPEQVEIPKLTDISIRQAREVLESKGFAIGDILLRPSEFDDLVLDQLYANKPIAPGSKLANGSTIDLVVGKKMADGETTVPALTLLTLSVAEEVLKSRSLTIGSIIYDPEIKSSEDTLNAVIWKQQPENDSLTRVMPGLSVDLWLRSKTKNSDSTEIKSTDN